MTHQTTVYLVDEDTGDRHYLAFRLGAVGMEAWPFASPDTFLSSLESLRPQLVLIAVEAGPHWGTQLIDFLRRREIDWPIIALSRSRDISLAVDTMKMGVSDFLTKPVDEDKLVAAVRDGASLLAERQQARQIRVAAEARVTALTSREISICTALLAGHPNKVIAYQLGISIRTVEAHRGNIMMKLGVRSIAEVLLLLTQAGLAPAASEPVPPRSQPRLGHVPPLLQEMEKSGARRERDYPAAA
jgi:two-component system response regulator FixJ